VRVVVLDLNVILDVLLTRHDSLECTEVLSLARSGMIDAFLPAHALSTIYYVSRKQLSDEEVREELRTILGMMTVASLSQESVGRALDSSRSDFEDALVLETAKEVNAEAIITRNISDFSTSSIPALTARSFMERMFRV
jgi:predicted nucleic acid-binding protein